MVRAIKSPLFVLPLLLMFVVGCSRCEECELNNASETICETEFDNTAQYEDAIADAEANGATCTPASGF